MSASRRFYDTEIPEQNRRLKGRAPGINLNVGCLIVASEGLGTPLRYDDFLVQWLAKKPLSTMALSENHRGIQVRRDGGRGRLRIKRNDPKADTPASEYPLFLLSYEGPRVGEASDLMVSPS